MEVSDESLSLSIPGVARCESFGGSVVAMRLVVKLSRNQTTGSCVSTKFYSEQVSNLEQVPSEKDSFQNFRSGGRAHLFAQNLDRIHHVISRQRRRWGVLGLSADLPGRRPKHVTLSSYKTEKSHLIISARHLNGISLPLDVRGRPFAHFQIP